MAPTATLLQIRCIEVPVIDFGNKTKDPVDEETEQVLLHPSRGPMAFNPGERMHHFKDALPSPMEHAWACGAIKYNCHDKGGGSQNIRAHQWQNKTATQRKVDLLTVAKKNRKFREHFGEEFCRRQEFDVLVRDLPLQLKKRDQGEGFHIGDTVECNITEGPNAGSRILGRICGEGEEGTWNVRVPAQPPLVDMPLDAPNVPEDLLHKVDVTVWRCTYKLGMDVRESPESEGPLKSNTNRTRPSLKVGEAVRIVAEELGNDGITYLRLEDCRGWIFDQKPGVGVACIRDENAGATATGINVVVPDTDEDGVTDLEVLGRRLRDADMPSLTAGLQKVQPEQRKAMLKEVPEAKHTDLLEHLKAQCTAFTMTQYLLSKEEA
eukprot:CAMPEP_0204585992 /NCGR_PEP_ID=MMETSP0661-20131031/47235_1 /ASSEMBLY_ACC=CAM_ASM_000606 /TAXON_ID=109239 /ORGANISM="Alexandrium margalefi, Strain AMGDE01CS-322" /LENGTH=378 /DNA_ID=CAMNT_0051595593 /DNA_START=42 /DNA_END=1178 /DNA_ORIENTATION=+